jgi:hypothetical protein
MSDDKQNPLGWSTPVRGGPPKESILTRWDDLRAEYSLPCCMHATKEDAEAAGYAHLPGCATHGNPFLVARKFVLCLVYVVTGWEPQ